MSKILTVNQLSKTYPPERKGGRSFTAVKNISFYLNRGEVLGLLGPNGAGKSTTIQMLMGVLTPTHGTIKYFGQDLKKSRSEIMQHVTFASTYVKMPWRLTVLENLRVYAFLYGLSEKTFLSRCEPLLRDFGVWSQRNKTLNELSAGQITRVMLVKAFIPHPDVALLDEPTASLDPDIAHQVREFVKTKQKKHGVSVLYTSHNMDEVTAVCDRVIFLQKGQIVAEGTPEELAQSVSLTRMRLMVKDGLKRTARFAKEQGWHAQVNRREILIQIEEEAIAGFLASLADEDIEYTQISIDKPTLEDYFLNMSLGGKDV